MVARKPKGHKVIAPLVQVVLAGRAEQFYQGDILPAGVSEESVKHLASLGYIEDADAPESEEA